MRGTHIAYKLLLTVSGVEVVNIGIAERTAGHGITANTNARDEQRSAESWGNDKTGGHKPRHGSDHVENLEEHCFSDSGIEFTDIQGGRRGRTR